MDGLPHQAITRIKVDSILEQNLEHFAVGIDGGAVDGGA